MSTTTTNLNLTKPANNENVDLSVINDNYDIIDQFAGNVPSTSDIPTATSDLENDSNFAVDADYVHTDNNYTTTEKTKLAGLNAVEANPSGSATAGNLTKLQVGSDIYAVPSGGGSGGGHTIENSSGTDMAQEDNLQFIGAYLEDDSTNDRTVVNVVREMTASEYDSLSSAEKEGIIHVTDEYDFDALYMVNGVFIDTDNVIVQETILSQSSVTYTATQDCAMYVYLVVNRAVASVNVDGVAVFNVYSGYSGNLGQAATIFLKKGQVVTMTVADTNNSKYAVYGIQTSDDVKSDYHIYSADEHVVGEWIDGSTLYEKTWDLESDINVLPSAWYDTLINEGFSSIIECFGVNSTGTYYPLMASIQSSKLCVLACRDGNAASVRYITAKYTKSS